MGDEWCTFCSFEICIHSFNKHKFTNMLSIVLYDMHTKLKMYFLKLRILQFSGKTGLYCNDFFQYLVLRLSYIYCNITLFGQRKLSAPCLPEILNRKDTFLLEILLIYECRLFLSKMSSNFTLIDISLENTILDSYRQQSFLNKKAYIQIFQLVTFNT